MSYLLIALDATNGYVFESYSRMPEHLPQGENGPPSPPAGEG